MDLEMTLSKTENFEIALQQLDAVVEKLEGGDLSLDESLTCFEEGVAAVRRCRERLQNAELRFEELSAELTSPADEQEG
jgi:exodeoxyribonuclease VII small subunit